MRWLGKLPLDSLTPNPRNRTITPAEAAEMAASLRGQGLIAPLAVRGQGDGTYMIICGHRRRAGAALLGWAEVACIEPENGQDDGLISAAENIQRRDLEPWQLSETLAELQASHDVKAVAATTGFSIPHIRNVAGIKAKLVVECWEVFKRQGRNAVLRNWIEISNRPAAVQRARIFGGHVPDTKDKKPRPSRQSILRQRRNLDPDDPRARTIDWILGEAPWPRLGKESLPSNTLLHVPLIARGVRAPPLG